MLRNIASDLKIQKTLKVLGTVNVLLLLLFSLPDSDIRLAACLIITFLLISQLHDIGRKRPGANFFSEPPNRLQRIYSQTSAHEIDNNPRINVMENIINGGGAAYDDFTEKFFNQAPNR